MSDSPDTRPPSNNPADVAVWQHRQSIAEQLGEVKAIVLEIRADLKSHIDDDADNFQRLWKAVRRVGRRAAQTATTYRMDRGMVLAWFVAGCSIIGVLWTLYDKVVK